MSKIKVTLKDHAPYIVPESALSTIRGVYADKLVSVEKVEGENDPIKAILKKKGKLEEPRKSNFEGKDLTQLKAFAAFQGHDESEYKKIRSVAKMIEYLENKTN